MSASRLRQVFPLIFPLVILLIIAFLPVSIPVADDVVVPPLPSTVAHEEAVRPIGPISRDVSASQQFPITGTRIRSLALLLSTGGRVNGGTARVTVQAETGGRWQDLTTQTVAAGALGDDAYYTLSFSPSLDVERGQLLRISLSSDGGPNDAIAWWINTTWKPEGYTLYYDGQAQEGTGCFRVSYLPASGRLFQMLGPVWERVTVFLGPWWRVMLVIGLGALVGILATLGYTLAR